MAHKDKPQSEELEPPKPAFYWWTLANILAASFALLSWVLCLHIFSNPEIPRNYTFLKKLGRIPELTRYTVLDVPNGNALNPTEIYGKYFGLSEEKRTKLNALLLRNYMRNFENNLLLTYAEGDYQVADVTKLEKGDFLYPGFAIRTQALVKQDDFAQAIGFPVVMEYIFPTKDTEAVFQFNKGDVLEVNKNPNCAAIIHISRTTVEGEQALKITAVPIAYGSYRVGEKTSFAIEPPVVLNPDSKLPIWK
ncbi:MAG: hypothetical protein ACK46A_01205 [Akkermansiaceae bacterium]